jgi:hypothetical protein
MFSNTFNEILKNLHNILEQNILNYNYNYNYIYIIIIIFIYLYI